MPGEGVKVYTFLNQTFRMGGKGEYIKTNIEEYERVDIGCGYFGILFKNKQKGMWHITLEDCGALIGSHKSKKSLIKSVKNDVETGDPELMKKQIEMGIKQMKQAKTLERDDWFSKFK